MIIAQAAEAVIHKEGNIIRKERISKTYRHPEIDRKLRTSRTRREAKILQKLATLSIPAPHVQSVDEKTATITMNYIDGTPLQQTTNPQQHATELGKHLAMLHNNHIIHGDLTTSNILVTSQGLHLIDFGLSFTSQKPEDKATDLHVLLQGLRALHDENFGEKVLASYSQHSDTSVLERLKKVENRGRNKKK